MKKYFIFAAVLVCFAAAFCLFFFQSSEQKPLSVVIIGAGPAGLSTAIEAKNQGAKVTIIEKRKNYSRNQVLFLEDASIKLLDKWKVVVPQMTVIEMGDGEKIGFTLIKNLEEALDYRIKLMGIKKVQGEFIDFQKGESAVQVQTKNNERVNFFYDILVGADGSHSSVRSKLGIDLNVYGIGDAVWSRVAIKDEKQMAAILPPILIDGFFVRLIQTPAGSIIFAQSVKERTKIGKEKLEQLVRGCGFKNEAEAIACDQAVFSDTMEVRLQQAKTFSDEKKSAILVGDAAATASFFQGKGANTAFKTAVCAGGFFRMVQEKNKEAYSVFNQAMKEVTDVMIEDSRFLFNEKKSAWSESN